MSWQNPRKAIVTIISTIFSILIFAWAGLIILNKQYIIDQITVWNFHPSAEITGLVNRAGMNDSGKFLYYASQPKIDGTQEFNVECNKVENITSILGCYSNSRIYIYDVTDPQLDGVREVTAAHETLHAVYARMSDSEKAKIDQLVENEYKTLANDQNFLKRMEFYAKAEPGQRDNELHSMIGTEVANIGPELEAHYDKYFSNRQKVVDLNTKYIAVFQKLETRSNELSTQLKALDAKIISDSDLYNSEVVALNKDIALFNKKASSGGFTSQYQFITERNALSSRVTELENLRNAINDEIAEYNALLKEYNSIATQVKKLYNSIDSTLAPAPSI